MLRRMVGCQDTAADLAQEAYVRLAHLPASQTIASPKAFLFRTATNLALDHFRREKHRGQKQRSLDEAEKIPTEAPPADQQVYDRQRIASLEVALTNLSERTRSVFVLRRVYGYSYQEIAVQLGISERSVEKHLVKAMTHCQQMCLNEDEPPADDTSGGGDPDDTSLGERV